ncbi:MAG: type II toxin-antitoxin system Phd/YefM family antitoxin [Candidatus Competibacter sp.]|nr:type II toxin-antitoxin system Phd/YefM family antitoxin [Candidatus Competibacter sp.]MDG4585762.1 type II toxin-antitoxin system Phd/YefM family antitoxin [Candidatus Competibacter sp.]
MLKLNIHEAKTHLSRYLPALERGETLILCKRNIPIAEIRPLPKPRALPRPIGLAADRGVELPPEFFEPLPAELLAAFGGETE